jgi:hypothetical protein
MVIPPAPSLEFDFMLSVIPVIRTPEYPVSVSVWLFPAVICAAVVYVFANVADDPSGRVPDSVTLVVLDTVYVAVCSSPPPPS